MSVERLKDHSSISTIRVDEREDKGENFIGKTGEQIGREGGIRKEDKDRGRMAGRIKTIERDKLEKTYRRQRRRWKKGAEGIKEKTTLFR